ncbi:hypothetical protein BOTBODRAFT_121128 [Botryobasidium botryosum FD-172 SS1]|uniref:RNA helicase n=1 Tax=Botryobasidium botryosum (strain FD-172 SS1) TaxID=930990 RepID=A0A067LUB0_BOTB1|nr:hypothetical protein BOTBODRAFT_121128 [Botryobasidium botryosum FD-172 SS1]
MKGDIIKVINPQGEAYEGRVGMIQDLHAGLSFHPSFRNVPGRLYNVEFLLNRNPLQRMHRALHQNFPMTRILFPAVEDIADASVAPVEAFQNAPLYNPLVAQNLPQLQAVASIVTQPAGSTPFVVFGPPGTGKTVTIVEAILQILKRTPAARILACAPSNSAADLIAKRLIAFGQLKPNELFRLIAPSCSLDIPTILKRYTFIHEGVFAVPRGNDPLGAYRVIVSTCVSADVPFGIGMELGHFSHIFIDEAGQALEPEVMIPIKTIADHRTNIILSGDPKQLGPVIHSPVGRILGLGVSYLDRLMAQDMYSSTVGHGLTTVKLVKNFRSHSAILNFSNEQFYEGELQVRGDPDIINSLIDWEGLVTPKFPVIFHGIAGQDLREGISPSYFNPDEASLVKEYVSALRSNASLGLDDSHIGVIAPYSAQCAKIRLLLKTQYPEINIGSAEQFQGQERRVIIISTVRSSREEVEFDLRHTLGFVANQRRFNVAVTRAQALLIVIGDPSVLSLDSMWREFMRYVSDNGGWRGVTMDGPQEEVYETNEAYVQSRRARAESQIQELVERVSGGGDVADDDGGGEVAADSPWRVME